MRSKLSNKVHLSTRIDPNLKRYLEKVTDNKSEYVENLIREDKQNSNLSDRGRLDEIDLCGKDPVYFIENYCYIQNPKDRSPSLISLYDYQKKIIHKLHNGKKVLLVKGRQVGASTSIFLYSLWKTLFNAESRCGVKTIKQDIAKTLAKRFNFSYQKLPDWLQKKIVKDTKFRTVFRDSAEFFAMGSAKSGRSQSFDFLGIDEASFFDNLDRVWSSFKPTIDPSISDGECLIVTNGIHDDNSNWEVLKSFYRSSEFENIVVPSDDILGKKRMQKNRNVLSAGKAAKEYDAIVHNYDEDE